MPEKGTWRYCIMKVKHPQEDYFVVGEVYSYKGHTIEPLWPHGETPEELIKTLQMMLKDAQQHKKDIIEITQEEIDTNHKSWCKEKK